MHSSTRCCPREEISIEHKLILLAWFRNEKKKKIHIKQVLCYNGRVFRKLLTLIWVFCTIQRQETNHVCNTGLAPEMVNKSHDYAVYNWTSDVLSNVFLYGDPPFEAESQANAFRR
ncbi:hypothetical protein RHSIM_Rhsim07G0025000 [Rhododendron simsii]|uniref:Uncharacterized protein n=1 Tax=Rhododendron simsii TaxID=118357 RepID=A0A834GQ31_RHOSS|nr:hypothetical protein RHSIM_Rhsim07G0025000 [Rhododendron simsii]